MFPHLTDYMKKKFMSIIFIILVIIFSIVIIQNWNKLNLSLMLTHWEISLLLITLAIFFTLTKSLMLYIVGRMYNIKRPFLHFFKVFCTSTFIELTTFTGKIGADGFKYYLWKELSKKKRLRLLIFLRSADITGILLLFGFIFLPLNYILILIIISLFVILLINKKKWWKWAGLTLIATIPYIIITASLTLIFNTLGLNITKITLTTFLTSHALGAISQPPLGLGAKDFSIFYQLKHLLTKEQIINGLIWARFCGEFITVLLGVFFTTIYLKKKK